MPAASFVLAFYLLARALTAIRLIGAHPLVDANTPFAPVHRHDAGSPGAGHARARWLDARLRGSSISRRHGPQSGLLAGQSALYVALLAGATMFDFYRKNFYANERGKSGRLATEERTMICDVQFLSILCSLWLFALEDLNERSAERAINRCRGRRWFCLRPRWHCRSAGMRCNRSRWRAPRRWACRRRNPC